MSRFALAEEERVLLDLETGSFYALNESAVLVAASVLRGEDAAAALVARYGLSAAEAASAARAFDDALSAAPPARRRNPLSFREGDDGLSLLHEGREVARLEAGRVEGGGERERLWAAPHLLALAGGTVLHASAVLERGAVIAFAGASGAGKTTLARELAARGRTLVSEDLVVLDGTDVLLEGEAQLRAWARSGGPLAAPEGARAPLRAIRFLDATRRGPLREEPLDRGAGLLLLLENGFAELPLRPVWEKLFETSLRLARTVRLETLTVPDGLDALRQTLNVAS